MILQYLILKTAENLGIENAPQQTRFLFLSRFPLGKSYFCHKQKVIIFKSLIIVQIQGK